MSVVVAAGISLIANTPTVVNGRVVYCIAIKVFCSQVLCVGETDPSGL